MFLLGIQEEKEKELKLKIFQVLVLLKELLSMRSSGRQSYSRVERMLLRRQGGMMLSLIQQSV